MVEVESPQNNTRIIMTKSLVKKRKKERQKIYERNPNTGVIRWRYTDESPDKFGWPNYGRILNDKRKNKAKR